MAHTCTCASLQKSAALKNTRPNSGALILRTPAARTPPIARNSHIHVYIFVVYTKHRYTYTRIYVYTYTYIYVYRYVYMYVYIYTYI